MLARPILWTAPQGLLRPTKSVLFGLRVRHISLASILLLVQVTTTGTDTVVRKHVFFRNSSDAAMRVSSTWSRARLSYHLAYILGMSGRLLRHMSVGQQSYHLRFCQYSLAVLLSCEKPHEPTLFLSPFHHLTGFRGRLVMIYVKDCLP